MAFTSNIHIYNHLVVKCNTEIVTPKPFLFKTRFHTAKQYAPADSIWIRV